MHKCKLRRECYNFGSKFVFVFLFVDFESVIYLYTNLILFTEQQETERSNKTNNTQIETNCKLHRKMPSQSETQTITVVVSSVFVTMISALFKLNITVHPATIYAWIVAALIMKSVCLVGYLVSTRVS